MTYEEKIEMVCDYIQHNLDGELTLDRLSSIAAVSRFHFHRLFSAGTGITLSRYIQLMRLKSASYRLAFSREMSVLEISLDAGFESPEAFARAFKRLTGQTPTEFRKKPDWERWHSNFNFVIPRGDKEMEVKIIDFEETKVAFLKHMGAPEKILESAEVFIRWRKATGLSPVKTSSTFGIPYGDPEVVCAEEFRFDICGSVAEDVPENEYGVSNGKIPAGRCAVVRHFGSTDNITETVYYLYREWLPESGEELRDFPCFFRYLNLIPEVAECDLQTDVYLPIL